MLLRRLARECEKWLPQSQAGFRRFRGCVDNIFILAELIDDVIGRDGEAYIVFIDFVAAFDSVSHKLLDQALAAAGAKDKSRAIFRAIYAKATVVVWVREGHEEAMSWAFGIGRGVVQGDICSPYGYIIALAFLFYKHDPEVVTGGGFPRWAGGGSRRRRGGRSCGGGGGGASGGARGGAMGGLHGWRPRPLFGCRSTPSPAPLGDAQAPSKSCLGRFGSCRQQASSTLRIQKPLLQRLLPHAAGDGGAARVGHLQKTRHHRSPVLQLLR